MSAKFRLGIGQDALRGAFDVFVNSFRPLTGTEESCQASLSLIKKQIKPNLWI